MLRLDWEMLTFGLAARARTSEFKALKPPVPVPRIQRTSQRRHAGIEPCAFALLQNFGTSSNLGSDCNGQTCQNVPRSFPPSDMNLSKPGDPNAINALLCRENLQQEGTYLPMSSPAKSLREASQPRSSLKFHVSWSHENCQLLPTARDDCL